MSDKVRNFLTILMLALLAGSAFVAGYFTNDYIRLRNGGNVIRNNNEFTVFWEAWGHIEDNFLGEIPPQQQVTYSAIRGSLSLLDDPYTIFIEPVVRQQEREALQGTFGGIGAWLSRPEEGGDIVLEPMPGNPAEIAGILADDVLIAVDGIPVTTDMTINEVVDLIKGEKGTTVVLTIRHFGETDVVDIEIERDDILIPSVSYRILAQEETIGYIRLSRFSGESSNEIETAVSMLQEQGATKLILDLRQNGGGLLNAAVDVADHFLVDVPILYQITQGQDERVFEATNDTLVPDIPLIILIDGGTASASEILAGALQDHDRAILVGSQSFGKGSVQLVYDLSDGSSVHVTSARWLTPNRNQIDQMGLNPDIVVEVTPEAVENGLDEILNRAIEVLQSEE